MIEVDQASLDQTMQRGIERPLLHLQHVVGRLLDGLRDRVAVRGAGEEGFENQEVERALQQLDALAGLFGRHPR